MKSIYRVISFGLSLLIGFCMMCGVDAYASEKVYVGGVTVGIELDSNGVVVHKTDEANKLHKEKGEAEVTVFCDGDLIVAIDCEKIESIEDIQKAMKKSDDNVEVTIYREGEKMTVSAGTYNSDGISKLGILAKDKIEGIGTITYIKQDGSYGGLGHPVSVWRNREPAMISGGKVCSSMILGINKGERGKAGELKGVFIKDKKLAGTINTNNKNGIFGKFDGKAWKNQVGELLETAQKSQVEIGSAQIYCTIDGNTPKYYDCEVVTKDTSKTKTEKGMVIKITDETLLEKTGGIVQGMSGSPIIQNGKLIGAVTHVFVADPTRGYGIFIENMLSAEKG